MFSSDSDPEFPNWWDVLDENADENADDSAAGDSSFDSNMDEAAQRETGPSAPGSSKNRAGIPGEAESFESSRVSESPVVHYSVSQPSTYRGYEKEVVNSVWNFAEIVAGNDPDLWRKDEWGNWIHRLAYGRRDSEFGWEIFDPGIGRHSQGVYAMRPMQWSRFLQQHEVFS